MSTEIWPGHCGFRWLSGALPCLAQQRISSRPARDSAPERWSGYKSTLSDFTVDWRQECGDRQRNAPMSPTDFFLLFVSLAFAAASIAAHGWTLNGIGPASIAAAAGFWQFWMQWLRHGSWLKHRDSGFAPGTQRLALSAAIGWMIGMLGALMWIIMNHK